MGKLIDLTGKKFGKWTVIKRVKNNKWGQPMWLCKCECGTEKIVRGTMLKSGRSKSCGCSRNEIGRYRLPLGLGSMRALIACYKKNARRRGIEYNLTEKQFAELTQKECHYCGSRPSQIAKNKSCNGEYIYNGLDRIDSSKGYTVKNTVPCCKNCNYAKNNLTLQEFKNWLEKAYNKMFIKRS